MGRTAFRNKQTCTSLVDTTKREDNKTYLTHGTGTPKLLVSFTVLQALGLPGLINLISVPDKCKLPLARLPHCEAVF